MKALVFLKPKDVSVDTLDDPRIEKPTDASSEYGLAKAKATAKPENINGKRLMP